MRIYQRPSYSARRTTAWSYIGTGILACLALFVAGCAEETNIYDGPQIEIPPLPAYRFPLQIDAGSESLVDQDGTPFFLHGDAGWSLISETRREDVELYLEDRVARGFNSILVVLIDHTDPLTNAYDHAPFLIDGDFATPNEDYFEYADWVIESATQRGLQVWLSPIYLGWEGGDEGFYQDVLAAGAVSMRAWGQWVGQRYVAVDGLVWLMGGDYVPPAEGLALLAEVAAGIAEVDSRHIFTAHWAQEVSGREVATEWLELNNTYTYGPVYLKTLEDYRSGSRPFVLLESIYENSHDAPTQQIRAQAYYALLAGAKGHFFGNSPVWKFGEGWQSQLNSRGTAGMMHLRALFAGIDWNSLRPDVDGAMIASGRGQWGERDYAVAARNSAGNLALVYVPTSRELNLDLSTMAGPCSAQWFDPTDGSYAPLTASPLPNSSSVVIPAPGNNGDGDGDWLLLLQVGS